LTFALDKLRISYASVTGNTAGITYIAQRARHHELARTVGEETQRR